MYEECSTIFVFLHFNKYAKFCLQIVLLSMHKYVPRIWIIRCDEAIRLSDLFSYPASSFKFNETEFIAVTAYQVKSIYINFYNVPVLFYKIPN